MEYIELDFLGSAKEIDSNFKKLYEKITGHQLKMKKKDQDKKTPSLFEISVPHSRQ